MTDVSRTTPTSVETVLETLDQLGSAKARAGMARFGVNVDHAKGVDAPTIKSLAKRIGRNHELALELWASGVLEARAIAALIADPSRVTAELMERWAEDFDNWATVDACCCYLFCRTPLGWRQAVAWAGRDEEYVKRAGFALMAYLAVHDKVAANRRFSDLLPLIERESDDNRNFVRKAVNWALRQIGKRSLALNRKAIVTANRIRKRETKAARWIAADALRELESEAVQRRLRERGANSTNKPVALRSKDRRAK